MKILLLNDDGISSKKLAMTRNILDEFGTVYTVAPAKEQSAKSMSLTYGGTSYKQLDMFTYAVDGTPVDCATFALLALKLKPDFVVSGTNNGYNIGIDIRYSGTVGAALQAQYFGYPSIAISSDYHGSKMIEVELRNTIKYVLENNLLSNDYTLNVNLPQDKFEHSKGIKHTKIYALMHKYDERLYEENYVPNRRYYWLDEVPVDSEQAAYLNGYTSITKVVL